MRPRFYAESDGDVWNKSHYVVDRYADPLSERKRTDCPSRLAAWKLTAEYNARPPWPVWDDIQATRDGYLSTNNEAPPA